MPKMNIICSWFGSIIQRYAERFAHLQDTWMRCLSTAFPQALNYASLGSTVDCDYVMGKSTAPNCTSDLIFFFFTATTAHGIPSADGDRKLQKSEPLGALNRKITYVNNSKDLEKLKLEHVLSYLQGTNINIVRIPWPVEPELQFSLWPLQPDGDLEAFERSVKLHGATKHALELRELLRVFHPDKWPKAETFDYLAPALNIVAQNLTRLYHERKAVERNKSAEIIIPTAEVPRPNAPPSFSPSVFKWTSRQGSASVKSSHCPPSNAQKKQRKDPWVNLAAPLPKDFVRNLTQRRTPQDATRAVWPQVPVTIRRFNVAV
ncbi:hypothetical protein B0H13DRAFT_1911299 [Mycena leptocephala]|nr:hypothetical protein B0H13DRAFT_1911299 [Mycena leptocephala]